MNLFLIAATLPFFCAFSSAQEVQADQPQPAALAAPAALGAKQIGDPCYCAQGLCTCGPGLNCSELGNKNFVCVPQSKGKAGDPCYSQYPAGSDGCSTGLVCVDGSCAATGRLSDRCGKDPVSGVIYPDCKDGLSCKRTSQSQSEPHHCVGGGKERDYCAAEDAGTGSASCSGNLLCRADGGDFVCVAPVTVAQNDPCDGDVHKCSSGLACKNAATQLSKDGYGEQHCVGRGLEGDLCAADDANAGSKSCGGNLLCRAAGKYYKCVVPPAQDAKCDPVDNDCSKGGLSCRNVMVNREGSNYHCVGRGQLNDLCAAEDYKQGSKSCGGDLLCRNVSYNGDSEYHCVGHGQAGDYCDVDSAGSGSDSCGGDLLCRAIGGKRAKCVQPARQNDKCDSGPRRPDTLNCVSGLSCKDAGKGDYCVGRGQLNDLCASDDANAGSKSCGGNLLCRLAPDKFYRCIAPLSLQQGDSCDSGEAGHGSASCSGSLKCRDVAVRGSDYRCVGRGLIGDLCAEADANAGSDSCSQDFLCRSQGSQYKCIARSEQNQRCGGSNSCKSGLDCRSVGSGDYCVGRGWRNDLCAKADAGNNSESCGGTLKCRDTGNSQWNCIGGGNEGDLCPHERGTPECGGSLVCRKQSDGKSRCVRK